MDPLKYDFSAIGNTGLKRFGGIIYEEFLPQLSGTRAVSVYREMADNDPLVGGIIYAANMILRQCEYKAIPANKSREAKAAAALVNDCMNDMETTWSDFVSEILSFVVYGWSYFEVIYKIRKDKRIGWRNISIRSQDSLYDWEIDDSGKIIGMYQQAPPTYQTVYIPLSKALLFRTFSNKNNPEGRSLLRNAYRSWFFLKRIQELEATGVERDLVGYPVMQLPTEVFRDPTPAHREEIAAFTKAMQQIRRDERECLILPAEKNADGSDSGYKFTLASAGGKRNFDTNQIITRYEQRITQSLLADFILLGTQSVGSFALASSKTSIFARCLSGIQSSILSTMNNDALPPLIAFNGIDAKNTPKIVSSDLDDRPLDELGAYVAQMIGAGAITADDSLEQQLRLSAKLPEKDELYNSELPTIEVTNDTK